MIIAKFNFFRLYYTKLQLGTPPREYYVQIDTGSDILWIGCANCNGCPETSGLPVNFLSFLQSSLEHFIFAILFRRFIKLEPFFQIQLNLYDPGSSSTASLISCSDRRCSLGAQSSDSACSPQSNKCSYTFQYGDGSGTSGYYVSDLLHLDMIQGNSLAANSSSPILLG